MTAPSGPSSVDNEEGCHESARILLPILTETRADYLASHSGFLIACYSEHPLVQELKSYTHKPVVGILEASVATAISLLGPGQSFGIVSTGKVWEELLSTAVHHLLGTEQSERFAGVTTTGLSATELHDAPTDLVHRRINEATRLLLRRAKDIGAICLGCAGMTGMDEWVREACTQELGDDKGNRVRIVDGVKSGFIMLDGLVKM